jgi:exopolysaccharide biosynthesis polyprenyl glycosylphosphotransferase
MYNEKASEIGRMMLFLDVVATCATFILAIVLRNYFIVEFQADLKSHMALLPLLLFFTIGFLSYFGAYEVPSRPHLAGYAWAIVRALVAGTGAMLVILFLLKIEYTSRMIIVAFGVMDFFLIFLVRVGIQIYVLRALKSNELALSVLIIGTGDRAKELSQKLRAKSEWGIDIIGHLDPDPARVGSRVLDAPVIGTVADIGRVLKDNVVDDVIIAIPRSMLSDAEIIASACEEEGIQLRFMADVFNLEVARVRLIELGKTPLLTMEPVFQNELKLLFKRCLDFVITLAAMPMVLPIIGVIAAAIKLDTPGRAFFVQQRVGLKKRIFPMIKFRSMYMGAEAQLGEVEHLNEAKGPIFKITDDPRVTRVGRFLRRTSLDELPQLFNVLRGEMSLVGPRPMSIRDVDLFDRGIQRKRFSVKPGITCLWQISGRSNLPFEKWLEMDLDYIENWSLFLDFKILLKTIPAVLFARGAV